MENQHYIFLINPGNSTPFSVDVSVTFIDKTEPSDLLKREDYWRSTLKTMAPFGLNIEESV